MNKSVRALADPQYDYYRLMKDFGPLKAGAIFFHDPDDDLYGSIARGCIKLCWTPDGDCYSGLCGSTVILHYRFVETDLFEKVERTSTNMLDALSQGYYGVEAHADGTWKIQKFGQKPW